MPLTYCMAFQTASYENGMSIIKSRIGFKVLQKKQVSFKSYDNSLASSLKMSYVRIHYTLCILALWLFQYSFSFGKLKQSFKTNMYIYSIQQDQTEIGFGANIGSPVQYTFFRLFFPSFQLNDFPAIVICLRSERKALAYKTLKTVGQMPIIVGI